MFRPSVESNEMTLFFFDKKNASISGRLVEDSNRDFTEIAADGGFELGSGPINLLEAAPAE